VSRHSPSYFVVRIPGSGPSMVVHAYNPSHSGGRGRRPTQTKLSRPYLKKKTTKKWIGDEAQW
jgi:hypothetical protein